MNLAQTFEVARPVAQHCAELIRTGPRPEERAQFLAAWRRDVTRELAQDMSPLLSGIRLKVTLSDPEMLTGEQIFERIGEIAANSLMRIGEGEQTVLLSIDLATAVALTDRSFGGEGEVELEQPESLPRSAALLIEEAARIIAQVLTRVSAIGGGVGKAQGDVIVRSENASRLKPFSPETQCALLTLELLHDDPDTLAILPWTARLAMPAERLEKLLPGIGSGDAGEGTGSAEPSNGQSAPFGQIPLPLEAVLAEFEMALAKLDRLKPGDQIPFAMAREVPLRIGAQTVARGAIGTVEDRIALRLTSSTSKGAAL